MTEIRTIPRWQDRIGGRWAISWQSFVVGASLNITILALTGGQIGAQSVQPTDIGAWALLGIVAALLVGAYALAADASVFKHRRSRPVPAWVSIAFHSGVGLIFGLVVVIGGDRFIEASDQNPGIRIVVIMMIGLWWGLTSALVLEARDRFNLQRAALIDRAVDLELATISESEAAMRLRSAIAREAEPSLNATRAEVDDVLSGFAVQSQTLLPVEEWWRISASLRETADATIRPLSHRLWEATERQYPRPALGRVFTRLVLYQHFAVLATMTILAIGYLPAGAYRLGLPVGVLATILMTVGAGAILAVANFIMRRTRSGRPAIFITAFVLVEVYAITYLAVLARLASDQFTVTAEVLGGAVAVGVSVLLPAAFACLNDMREEVLDRFRLDTDEASVRQLANARQLAQVARQAARDLHGSVQTRLISCAVAIEQASRSGDVSQFRQALELSIAILDAPLPDQDEDPSSNLQDSIAEMCSPWEGLCRFTIEADADVLAIQGPIAMAGGRIVEEAVANACRHGLAESVAIRVTRVAGPALRFEIEDDGSGPSGGGPGLGTAMLAGLSRGRVALEAAPSGGARLTVLLPID